MRIDSLTMSGFKKWKEEVTFSFDPKTTAVYGKNKAGKTTLLEGICITLYGRDLMGDNRGLDDFFNKNIIQDYLTVPQGLEDQFEEFQAENTGLNYVDALNKFRESKGLQQYAHKPSMQTTVLFDLNNEQHLLTRRRLYGGATTVKLDDRTISQSALEEIIPEWKLFYSIFVPGYFLNQLDKEDQRELLTKYLPKADWKQFLEVSLPTDLSQNATSLEALTAVVSSEFKEKRKDAQALKGKLDYIEERLSQTGDQEALKQIEEMEKRAEEARLSWERFTGLSREHSTVSAHNEQIMKNNEIAEEAYKKALEVYEKDKERIAFIEKRIKEIEPLLVEPTDKSDSLLKEAEAIDIPSLELPPSPAIGSDEDMEPLPPAATLKECPECGADLEAYVAEEINRIKKENEERLQGVKEKKEKLKKEWEEECEKLTEEHEKKHSELFDKRAKLLEQASKEREDFRNRYNKYTQLLTERGSLLTEKANLTTTEPVLQKTELLAVPEELKGMTPSEVTQQETELLGIMEKHRSTLADYRAEVGQIPSEEEKQQLVRDKGDFEIQLGNTTSRVEVLKDLKRNLSMIPNKMMRHQFGSILESMPLLDIRMFSEVKSTGELKPDLVFMYEGKVKRCLSTSEEIALGIELGVLLNSLAEERIPIFVDNGESISVIPASAAFCQLIVAYVHPNYEQLTLVGSKS